MNIQSIGTAIGSGLNSLATYSARSAQKANGISAQAQSAQGAFNQASANTANSIGDNRLASQYDYNSAMMQAANAYNTQMWDKTAAWNEEMWERQAQFNAEQAQLQREWAERMDNTRYQRAITDMQAAGLNPILAVTGGGIQTGGASGTAATVGGAQMSSAQSAMTSGGLLGANQASEGNYTGQMEYMGGTLGLISAALSGLGSAMTAIGGLGKFGEGLGEALGELFTEKGRKEIIEDFNEKWKTGRENQKNPNYKPYWRNGIDWNMKRNEKYTQ